MIYLYAYIAMASYFHVSSYSVLLNSCTVPKTTESLKARNPFLYCTNLIQNETSLVAFFVYGCSYYFAELAAGRSKMAYQMVGDSRLPGKIALGQHHSVTVKVSETILLCIFTGMKATTQLSYK